MDDLWLSLVICSLSAGAALLLARRVRRRKTQIAYAVGQWVLFSFVSFLLLLVINTVGIDWYYVDDVAISSVYTYIIEDSRYFGMGSRADTND